MQTSFRCTPNKNNPAVNIIASCKIKQPGDFCGNTVFLPDLDQGLDEEEEENLAQVLC